MTDEGEFSRRLYILRCKNQTCCVTCVSISGRVARSRRLSTSLETSVTSMLGLQASQSGVDLPERIALTHC